MGITSLINAGLVQKGSVQPSSGQALERDPYAPNYELMIYGGKGAQAFSVTDQVKNFITEISYEDNADQFDKLTLTIENQQDDAGGGDVNSLIDSVLFAEGHIIEVQFGYGRSLHTIGACDIVKKHPDFPENGSPSLQIECYDSLQRLARNKPRGGATYKNSTPTEIVREIGIRNGLVVDAIDPSGEPTIDVIEGVFKGKAQDKGTSDYQYLKKLADIYQRDIFTRFDPETKKFVLHFKKPANIKQKEVFTFVYNEGEASYENTLLSFQPSLDSYDQGTDFEVFLIKDLQTSNTKTDFIDQLTAEEQNKIKASQERRFTGGNASNDGKQTPNFNGVQVAFKAFGKSFRFPKHKRFNSEEEVVREIENFVKRQKQNFITGSGNLIGVEVLQSRQVHNLQGISEQFSGKYFFHKVSHTMSKSKGYECSFQASKVIEDEVVKPTPTLELSENDLTIKALKGLD